MLCISLTGGGRGLRPVAQPRVAGEREELPLSLIQGAHFSIKTVKYCNLNLPFNENKYALNGNKHFRGLEGPMPYQK